MVGFGAVGFGRSQMNWSFERGWFWKAQMIGNFWAGCIQEISDEWLVSARLVSGDHR